MYITIYPHSAFQMLIKHHKHPGTEKKNLIVFDLYASCNIYVKYSVLSSLEYLWHRLRKSHFNYWPTFFHNAIESVT